MAHSLDKWAIKSYINIEGFIKIIFNYYKIFFSVCIQNPLSAVKGCSFEHSIRTVQQKKDYTYFAVFQKSWITKNHYVSLNISESSNNNLNRESDDIH